MTRPCLLPGGQAFQHAPKGQDGIRYLASRQQVLGCVVPAPRIVHKDKAIHRFGEQTLLPCHCRANSSAKGQLMRVRLTLAEPRDRRAA